MEIVRAADRTRVPGPVDWFTGDGGAAPGERMSHVAVAQPGAAGRSTYWQAHVTDAEYRA